MSSIVSSAHSDAPRRHRGRPHAAHRLGWAATELQRVKAALTGRNLLIHDDILFVVERIAEAQSEIAKASAHPSFAEEAQS